MADYVGGDMIRGHIDTIILNSLIESDKDTNEIRTQIEERAAGQFQLKQGTFYSALQRIVKQGYAIEYRTTSSDGVRRKFFQLTEKGKDHIEQNQSSWTFSRGVINTLLNTVPEKQKVVKVRPQEEESIPEFESEKITGFSDLNNKTDAAEESAADQVIKSIADEEYTDESFDADTVFAPEPENAVQAEAEIPDTAPLSESVPEALEPVKAEEPEESDDIEKIKSIPKTFDDIFDILKQVDIDEQLEAERRKKEQEAEEAEEARLKAEEEQREKEAEEARLKAEEEQKRLDEQAELFATARVKEDNAVEVLAQQQEDDYLDIDDLPLRHEYKTILSKIFEKDNKEEEDQRSSKANYTAQNIEQTSFDTSAAVQKTTDDEEDLIPETPREPESDDQFDVIVDNLDFSSDVEKLNKNAGSSRNKSAIDYSDIIALSKAEGFRVTTSDRTNKSELGKILINRLNFHSSLLFTLLTLLEVTILWLTMESILDFGYQFYIYFGLVMLIFPIISSAIYYMAPKRTVAEVSPFKSAFETALIITLDLILIILVVSVIIDIDFSSSQALSRYVFLPLIIVLNVPIYIIIRYSLLEKQMYFS